MVLKVAISGPRGKMGSKIFNFLKDSEAIQVVGLLDYKPEKWEADVLGIPVYDDVKKCFKEVEVDVFIDFTNPEASFTYICEALKQKVKVICGTTGFSDEQLQNIKELANRKKIGCVIAPNFALGAVFMMIFSSYAAKYFNAITIIERHHEEKHDIPSGTAETIKQSIIQNNQEVNPKIQSLRLPGYIAHHEVIFGGPGQILTIKHDSHNRESFLDGILLTLNEIDHIHEFVFGLENVLRL